MLSELGNIFVKISVYSKTPIIIYLYIKHFCMKFNKFCNIFLYSRPVKVFIDNCLVALGAV